MIVLVVLLLIPGILSLQRSFHHTTNTANGRRNILSTSATIKSTISVPDNIKKVRLDVFLSESVTSHSRSFYGGLCDKRSILVNNVPRDKAYKVSNGDVIEFEMEEKPVNQKVEAENIPLDIIYEDENIISINKPCGMVVHPAPGSPNGTFVNALLYHLGDGASKLTSNTVLPLPLEEDLDSEFAEIDEESFEDLDLSTDMMLGGDSDMDTDIDADMDLTISPGTLKGRPVDLPETPEAARDSPTYLRPGVVHRLDKGTSGVLIAGKHNEAVAKLSLLFAARKVKKIYLAICIGHPGEATIVEPIGRSLKNRQMMTVYDGPPGKLAISHVKTIAFDGKLSACLVRIETGRTHQIRVHMKHRHTPIVGDEIYGNKDWNSKAAKSNGIMRPLLHAYETQFVNPFTKETITLRAPLPEDIKSLLSKLSKGLPEPIFDDATGFLTCSTDVTGRTAGEKLKGFVPFDRIAFEEEHWTSMELPETMESV